MKNYLIPFVALAVIATSCTKNNHDADIDGSVEIKLTSGIATPSTKGPVISDASDKPVAEQSINFLRAADAATIDWTTAGTAAQTNIGYGAGFITAKMATVTGVVTFTNKQYYNANPSLNSALVGYAPTATLTTETNEIKAAWPIDGKTDVIVSQVISGNKSNSGTALAPAFQHLLTWLEFKIIATDAAAQNVWGNVTSIEINDTYNGVTSLLGGTAYNSTPVGSADQTIGTYNLTDVAPAATMAPTGNAAIFSQALVYPATGYNITVKTTNNTAGVKVAIVFAAGTQPAAGTKHEVTVTFNSQEITATGTIKAWVDGAPGSVTVD